MGYFRDNVEQAAGYTPGFQPKQADLVKLNTNENPYPPSPMVMAALAAVRAERGCWIDPLSTAAGSVESAVSTRTECTRASCICQ